MGPYRRYSYSFFEVHSLCSVQVIRSSAEFAKEAMMGQMLMEGSEGVLTVRWANDDPNPTATLRVKRKRSACT